MSWDYSYFRLSTICPCKNGKIVALKYKGWDDWNRLEDGISKVIIECPVCNKQYYIKHITEHHWCPSWKGSGVSHSYYCVSNDIDLDKFDLSIPKEPYLHIFHSIEEETVVKFTKYDLELALTDMVKYRWLKEITEPNTLSVVNFLVFDYGKRLKNLRSAIQDIIENYDKYKENYDLTEQKKKEEYLVEEITIR